MDTKTIQITRLSASAPRSSAWVSANAGAGKTHLLVARVLRLLLSGVPPSRILCITYTKAAAAEMTTRVMETASRWAVMEEGALQTALLELMGAPPSRAEMKRARTLFTLLADQPDALRMQTIHAFCQSLLARFPLEAGVAPYFSVVDDHTAEMLLKEAGARLFSRSLHMAGSDLEAAMQQLAARMGEYSFHELLKALTQSRRALHAVLESGLAAARARVHRALAVSPQETLRDVFHAEFTYQESELAALRACIPLLQAGTPKTDHITANILTRWCEATSIQREAMADEYAAHFCKSRIYTKAFPANHHAIIAQECERAERYLERTRAIACAQLSYHVLTVAEQLLHEYERLKHARAVADYEDLIMQATRLLSTEGIHSWVMYKLDGGIDHVLIDEAQDTSAEQWAIARALTAEFFAGEGVRDSARTLFAVGDAKQSIFSFQGAAPALFEANRVHTRTLAAGAKQAFAEVSLPESFRTVPPVLSAVDAVFQGRFTECQHTPIRSGQAGVVEVWPLIRKEKKEAEQWLPALDYIQREKPVHALASAIAQQIAQWLARGEMLESLGRPMTAGDIMILVRSRKNLVPALMRALRAENIPVAGVDRLVLSESLVAKDLLALASFALLPEDDLNLASLLKCPLFEVNEELLFALAYERGERALWQRLREMSTEHPAYAHAYEVLSTALAAADYAAPYEFFAHILQAGGGRERFAARMGEAVLDALDEFLNQALVFEQQHPPSLQGFVQWMQQNTTHIKRDMEQAGSAVRIMTVHAAKGLEAPVVMLPDTASAISTHHPKFEVLEEEGALPTLLWAGSAEEAPEKVRALKEQRKAREQAEYQRLLYVAMTRARDRLYIMGAQTGNYVPEECWYEMVHAALQPISESVETKLGQGLRLQSAQTAAVKPPAPVRVLPHASPAPVHLFTRAEKEEATARPLSPSALFGAGDAMETESPARDALAIQRGVMMHRLLQHLPALAPEKRDAAARTLLSRSPLPESLHQQMAEEALTVLNHPAHAPFFSHEALAEVPLAGMVRMNGQAVPITGQIDRLCITPEAVWVLDYKTGAAPKSLHAVPTRYIRQMAAYRALMCAIYPERTIRTALLFTQNASLMELPEAILIPLCQTLTDAPEPLTYQQAKQ